MNLARGANAPLGQVRSLTTGCFRVGYLSVAHRPASLQFMSRIHLPGLSQPLAGRLLRLVVVAMCSGAFALYALGTDWYWLAVGQLPRPIVASIYVALGRARSLLADDAAVAEDQAEFYAAWFLVCCVAFLGWIAAATFRRVWLGRKTQAF